MPGGDRTGPMGQGPMTGRAAGYCAGAGQPGYATGGFGRGGRGGGGFGGGRRGGGGLGRRNWFYATGLTGWQRAAQAAGEPAAPQQAAPPQAAPPPPSQPASGSAAEVAALRAQLDDAEAMLGQLRARLDAQGGPAPEDSSS